MSGSSLFENQGKDDPNTWHFTADRELPRVSLCHKELNAVSQVDPPYVEFQCGPYRELLRELQADDRGTEAHQPKWGDDEQ
jgi:hypothetical protein